MHTSLHSKLKICKLDKLKFFGCSEWSVMIPSPVYRTDPERKKKKKGFPERLSSHRATKMGSVRTHHFGTQNLIGLKLCQSRQHAWGPCRQQNGWCYTGPEKERNALISTVMVVPGMPGQRKNTDFGGGGGGGGGAFGGAQTKKKHTAL
jgi:hypothetical protein